MNYNNNNRYQAKLLKKGKKKPSLFKPSRDKLLTKINKINKKILKINYLN